MYDLIKSLTDTSEFKKEAPAQYALLKKYH